MKNFIYTSENSLARVNTLVNNPLICPMKNKKALKANAINALHFY